MIADNGAVFGFTIVIACNSTATDIGTAAYIGVAYIGKMRNFGSFAYIGIFNFYKVAYFGTVGDIGLGT